MAIMFFGDSKAVLQYVAQPAGSCPWKGGESELVSQYSHIDIYRLIDADDVDPMTRD